MEKKKEYSSENYARVRPNQKSIKSKYRNGEKDIVYILREF